MLSRSAIKYHDLVPAIMSPSCLKILSYRGKVRRVVMGGNGREAMYDVESLPERYRREVYRRYPDLVERGRSEGVLSMVELDGAAVAYYAAYQLGGDEDPRGVRHLPLDKQQEYANNASELDGCRSYMT